MSIKLLNKLTVATASTAISLAAASFAQSAQAASVNYSYTGLAPEQSMKGSFSYADDFAGSVVSWNDLTAFTISYNGGVQLDKAAVESLFPSRSIGYYASDVTYGSESRFSTTFNAGSLNFWLTNLSKEGSLYSSQSVSYINWFTSTDDYKSANSRSFMSNHDTHQYGYNTWMASNNSYGSWTYTNKNDFGETDNDVYEEFVADVGTWLVEKVSGITAPASSCGASPSVAIAE
jgi:hypothetical protein